MAVLPNDCAMASCVHFSFCFSEPQSCRAVQIMQFFMKVERNTRPCASHSWWLQHLTAATLCFQTLFLLVCIVVNASEEIALCKVSSAFKCSVARMEKFVEKCIRIIMSSFAYQSRSSFLLIMHRLGDFQLASLAGRGRYGCGIVGKWHSST